MTIFIGLDIGGTKIMVAAADEKGNIVHRKRASTPINLEDGLNVLHRMIEEVSKGEEVQAIGAAIGGPVDWRNGIVSPLHQSTWREVPLKQIMEAQWDCPFFVDVDTNIAAIGEYYVGKVSASSFLYVTISTGMGGGFIHNGKLFRGHNNSHPEIAHQSIHWTCSFPERIICECGAPDCLEALISGNGIRRVYGKPAQLLGKTEWEEVAYNLGQGLRNLAVLYAPEEISIGGGVAVSAGNWFLPHAVKVMHDYLRLVPPPHVQISRLGYDTALIGAIAVAINGLSE
jgi:predicted NBD/HSP70 family sugar kinase